MKLICGLLLCGFSTLLFLFPGASALAEIRVATPAITSLLNEEQTGLYQRIMRRAMTRIDIPLHQSFFPYKRALAVFKSRQADCIYSFTDVVERDLGSDRVISGFPLGAFSYYMFTRKGEAPMTSPEQLAGRRVAGVIGAENYFRAAIQPTTHLILVNSDRQSIDLLEQKRVDVIIAAIPDIALFVGKLSYSPTRPLFTGYDRMTCHRNAETTAFIRLLSGELRRLKATGVYRQMAGDLYVDFDSAAAECPEGGPCRSWPIHGLLRKHARNEMARKAQ